MVINEKYVKDENLFWNANVKIDIQAHASTISPTNTDIQTRRHMHVNAHTRTYKNICIRIHMYTQTIKTIIANENKMNFPQALLELI